jgi:7-cyano-7-deazaguanine synthase in queuosine biosynthesis
MKLVCGPSTLPFKDLDGDIDVLLYDRALGAKRGSAGAAIAERMAKRKLAADVRAWDFLSLALSVVAADLGGHRRASSDGWTREFELAIAVSDPTFWNAHAAELETVLKFLTTDRWKLAFIDGASYPAAPQKTVTPNHDSVVLVSGGLDSFTGALDLVAQGHTPIAVSQSVTGDAEKQRALVAVVGADLDHLQVNHNAQVPKQETPPSQRARSIGFFSYGVLAATTLKRYRDGDTVPLYVCENGFISINPPLTGSRIGSLSTRTSHPVVINGLQRVFDAAGLRIRFETPYAYKTKGEMLTDCQQQTVLKKYAHTTTSCGRFGRFGFKHCGRCVPCLIRRASFHAWKVPDQTKYVYTNLGRNDDNHAKADDVRAAAMAVAQVAKDGIDGWLGAALSVPILEGQIAQLKDVASRGLNEIAEFLKQFAIR